MDDSKPGANSMDIWKWLPPFGFAIYSYDKDKNKYVYNKSLMKNFSGVFKVRTTRIDIN